MRVLVCGGRHHANRDAVFQLLDHYNSVQPFSVVIHGAATGADQWADAWAKARGVPIDPYPAQWTDMKAIPCVIRYRQDGTRYNAAAGGIRNAQMLRKGKPDVVVAFSGGNGTRDMIGQARDAGVPVLDLRAFDNKGFP